MCSKVLDTDRRLVSALHQWTLRKLHWLAVNLTNCKANHCGGSSRKESKCLSALRCNCRSVTSKPKPRAAVALSEYIKQTRRHLPHCKAHSMRWSFQAFVSDQPVCTLQGLCSGKMTAANCHLQSLQSALASEFKQSCDPSGKWEKCRSKARGKQTAVTSGQIASKAAWHRFCKHLGGQSEGFLHLQYAGRGVS